MQHRHASLELIKSLLRESKNNALVSQDGIDLYVWVKEEDAVLHLTGPNWNTMTPEEIDARLQRERTAFFERVRELRNREGTE